MATRLYFVANKAPSVSPAFGAWQDTSQAVRRKLSLSKFATTETRAGTMGGAINDGALIAQFISDPLDGDQVISGTFSMTPRGRELDLADNINNRGREIRVIKPDGTDRGVCTPLSWCGTTTEMLTSHSGQTCPLNNAITPVNALHGDRILIEFAWRTTVGGTTPQWESVFGGTGTDHTTTVNDQTGTVPWAEFSADLAFQSPSDIAVIEAVRHTMIAGAGATQIVAETPGGGKIGKTLVALVTWRGVGTVTPADGSWVEHYDYPDTLGSQLALYTRPSTDAEPANYTFNFSGAAARVIASLFFISNSENGIEVFSAEGSGNSLTPTAPSVTSPGDNRLCLRIWNKTHTNNMVVPSHLNIVLRWNTGGSDAGACGHVMTADRVNAGATVAEQCQLDTFAREWRAVTLIVGPGLNKLSKADRLMAELSGLAGSSLADKERGRLEHLVGANPTLSLEDLYELAKSLGQSDGKNRLL